MEEGIITMLTHRAKFAFSMLKTARTRKAYEMYRSDYLEALGALKEYGVFAV